MQQYLIKFIEWAKLKIKLQIADDKNIYFHEREIWWTSLGVNIGFEQDGKNKNFERPILILKKFSRYTLWILPLTSKEKTGRYYYQFKYNGKKYSVILTQLRLISSKRLLRKIRTFPDIEFQEVKKFIKELI